jgi:hypothetical protein
MVAASNNGIHVQLLQDGKPVTPDDLSAAKAGGSTLLNIKESRLYNLIENARYGEHTLKIVVPSGGLRAFSFTFG